MALPTNTTGSAGLAPEMKTYYDRRLLVRTTPMLLYSKFAQERNIPRNNGKIVEFRRFTSLATATTPLTEGQPPTLKSLEVTNITAEVSQYGDGVSFSDLVSTTTIDPLLSETTDILADQAAESIDEITRNKLVAGTTVLYGGDATARNELVAADTFDIATLRRAVLQLKINRARKINGFYHAIIHPRTEHDLIGTAEWIAANQYAGSQRIFDGSIGTLYGVKFWVTDVAPVIADAGAGSTEDVFQTLIFGANAYGIVRLAGHNLRTIYKPLGSAGTADPLDQQQSMAWKVTFTVKILNDLFMARVEHCTSTGDNA